MSSKNNKMEIEERMARQWRDSVAEDAGDIEQIVKLEREPMMSDSLVRAELGLLQIHNI